MKSFKSHFKFNKDERSGIYFLLLLIVVLQLVYFGIRFNFFQTATSNFETNTGVQSKLDSVKNQSIQKDSLKIYPFNPNYITDYKGYVLGMSTAEIDRLLAFREQGTYVNSATEFQQVTQVSDSLLSLLSVYFKFPEWANIKNKKPSRAVHKTGAAIKINNKSTPILRDLNAATAEELQKINGIGEVLSARIVKFRTSLGGFLVNDQLYDVYGLEAEVIDRLLTYFTVRRKPSVALIPINKASAYEISKIVYIKYGLAKNIVAYRDKNGAFVSFEDLANVHEFPSNKIDRIKLYLTLD